MTSPAITAAAASTRRPGDVLKARAARKRMMPIGRMFLIEVSHKDGAYFTESEALPRGKNLSVTDGLILLQGEDDAVAIWELNPSEGGMRDVSEDMARLWLAQFDGERGELPAFITLHLDDADIDAKFDDAQTWVDERRSLASVQATGRV